jgi:hypothetical protein
MNRYAALAAVLLLLSLPAPAAGEVAKGRGDQQQLKAQVIQHIDARIRILEEARACVARAANTGAVALCHQQERRKTKALREKDRLNVK